MHSIYQYNRFSLTNFVQNQAFRIVVKFVLFCTATSGRILRKLVVSFNDPPDANLQLLSSTLLLPVLTCIASFDSQLYPLTKLAFYEPKGSERTAHKTKTHVSSMASFDETMGNSLSYDDDGDESDESPHRHTQFLDLTNGEGGDQTNFYEDEDDGGGGGDEDEAAASSTASKPAACDKINPNTPGKVVETGQEHTGRWTREEHAAFLSALKQYGKEWKKVAAKVKTRTVVQTRTHAQKYFQKLQKALQTNAPKGGTVEMGVDSRQKALALKKKQQQQQQYQQKKPPIIRSQSTASTHAAAHLMTNLASGASGDIPSPPVKFAPNTSSFGTGAPYSTAQISAPSFTTHGFSSANNSHNDQPLLAPQSIPSYPGGFFGRSGSGGMSITAPEHDAASRMGKFPEPSPAATGKRKLAEIAAAQMLAGVMGGKDKDGGGDITPPPPDGLPDLGQKKIASLSSRLSLQIVNPESLGITYDGFSKRNRGPGGSSPTTPWDGELEALVRYVRSNLSM